jgi:multicomponent Na+:H+ antiporter subunit D
MVGVPPAVGFVGKWYIAVGAVESGVWPVAAVILGSTVLTLAYFARVIERMYFASAPTPADADGTAETLAGASSTEAVADGGATDDDPDQSPVSVGMVLVVVAAAVAAVALGFLGSEIEQFLEPLLTEVFGQ